MSKSVESIDATHLIDYKLPDQDLLAIAKIAMLGSELDDALSQCIALVTKMPRPATYMLLGRTGISQKLDQLHYLLKSRGLAEQLAEFKNIEIPTRKFIRLRNLVCHGIYMGKHKQTEHLVFLKTADQYEPAEALAAFKADGIDEKSLLSLPDLAQPLVQCYLHALGAQSLRETHFPEFRLPK